MSRPSPRGTTSTRSGASRNSHDRIGRLAHGDAREGHPRPCERRRRTARRAATPPTAAMSTITSVASVAMPIAGARDARWTEHDVHERAARRMHALHPNRRDVRHRPFGRPRQAARDQRASRLREREPGLDDRIGIERHALDALLDQPLREIRMVGRPLPADADVLAVLLAGLDREREHRLHRIVALVERGRDRRRRSRDRRRASAASCRCEPIEKPSKYSRKRSARIAFDGSSHIMITRRPLVAAHEAVLRQQRRAPGRLRRACARTGS